MKAGFTLTALFLVGVLAAGSPRVGTAQAQGTVPVSPPANPRPEPRRMPVVEVDLLAPNGTEPLVVLAPLSEPFNVVLQNRAPGALYRVTHDWLLDPATPSRPPAAALHKEQDLRMSDGRRTPPFHFSPECDDLLTRADDLLAARDEATVAEGFAALKKLDVSKACGPRVPASYLEGFLGQASWSLNPYFTVYPGDEVRLTVERLDPGTRTALRSWRFVVRANTPRLDWAHANEEAWIVGETSRDIVEMILYARAHSLPTDDELKFSTVAAPVAGVAAPRHVISFAARAGTIAKSELTFSDHIWAPAAYEPLARTALQSLGLRAAAASDGGALAEALLDPRSVVLEAESHRVSDLLERAMLDPGAHEQAALILGTLALREAAGRFSDPRQTLCRMAAHMAVARALQSGTTSRLSGYANAVMLTLVKRQRDALQQIAGLEGARPSAAWGSYLKALRIHNTSDWRILREPGKASLLERLEHFHALQQSLGGSQAFAFLESTRPQPMSDWARIAFTGGLSKDEGTVSVDEGNVLGDWLVATDASDAADVWKAFHGTTLQPEKLVEALNEKPRRLLGAEASGKVRPRVVAWGLWARFFERNLCFGALASVNFLDRYLTLPERAREANATWTDKLSGLDLWPGLALGRLIGGKPAQARPPGPYVEPVECTRAENLVHDNPQWITAEVWDLFQRQCVKARNTQSIPPVTRWFNGLVPAGTALLERWRGAAFSPRDAAARQAYTVLHEQAPFDTFIPYMATLVGPTTPFEEMARVYGPLADYDLAVMKRLASAREKDPEAYRALYAKITAIDPDAYLQLGDYLRDREIEADAAAAYERAIEKALDRVAVSAHVRWLVGYYLDHGRTDRARQVADLAAETYSGAGLVTMGYFLERTRKYDDAEQWYRKMIERYDNRGALDAFYIRYEQRVGDDRFKSQAAAARKSMFPGGLERVSLAELTAPPPPQDGFRLTTEEIPPKGDALTLGDVVVAVNGQRVHNETQYDTLLTLDDNPMVTVIVWRQAKYVQVEVRLSRRKYAPISRPV